VRRPRGRTAVSELPRTKSEIVERVIKEDVFLDALLRGKEGTEAEGLKQAVRELFDEGYLYSVKRRNRPVLLATPKAIIERFNIPELAKQRRVSTEERNVLIRLGWKLENYLSFMEEILERQNLSAGHVGTVHANQRRAVAWIEFLEPEMRRLGIDKVPAVPERTREILLRLDEAGTSEPPKKTGSGKKARKVYRYGEERPLAIIEAHELNSLAALSIRHGIEGARLRTSRETQGARKHLARSRQLLGDYDRMRRQLIDAGVPEKEIQEAIRKGHKRGTERGLYEGYTEPRRKGGGISPKERTRIRARIERVLGNHLGRMTAGTIYGDVNRFIRENHLNAGEMTTKEIAAELEFLAERGRINRHTSTTGKLSYSKILS